MQRVAVYVDGFNLYHGLRDRGWRRYYWLDLCKLATKLLAPNQQLALVRYFTARVMPEPADPRKPDRQAAYLEALATLPDLHIHYGRFARRRRYCAACGAQWQTYEEKLTDVNIAVELLGDAQANVFDTALVVSADGDLTGLIGTIPTRFPAKRVVVAFPPGRHSNGLRQAAGTSFSIWRQVLRDSQLPRRVTTTSGYVVTRPRKWR